MIHHLDYPTPALLTPTAAVPARPIIPLPDAPIEYPPAEQPEPEPAEDPAEQPAEPVTVPAPAEPEPALPAV